MNKEYNQLLQHDTYYGCSIYALLSLFRYDYGVFVPLTKTLIFLTYLEKIGVFFRLEGAYAKYIFPAALKHINKLFGLDLALRTKTLKGKMSYKHGYILGFKKATTFYKRKAEDGEITKQDIEEIKTRKQNGHFHFWKRDTVVESLGGFRYKLTESNLKYAYGLDLYYPNVRYITGEEELKRVFINIVKLRKLQKKENPYIQLHEIAKIKEEEEQNRQKKV